MHSLACVCTCLTYPGAVAGVLYRVDNAELVQHFTHDDDTDPDCGQTGSHGPEGAVGRRQGPQHHQDQIHQRRLQTLVIKVRVRDLSTIRICQKADVDVEKPKHSLRFWPTCLGKRWTWTGKNQRLSRVGYCTSSSATHTAKRATIFAMWSSRSLQTNS